MFSGTLVYLHGFRSSPQSQKARLIEQALAGHPGFSGNIHIPDLGFDVRRPMAQLQAYLETASPPFVFVGSSLGGYYATYLAERSPPVLACATPANVILVNPSVRPFELLQGYLGWVDNLYSGERFEVKPEYFDLLKAYHVNTITHPERYLLLTKTKDEVLDYWQAVEYFKGANMLIDAGGNHGYEDLPDRMSQIFSFIGLETR